MIALSSHTRVAFIAVAKVVAVTKSKPASKDTPIGSESKPTGSTATNATYLYYAAPTSPRIASFSSFLLSCIVPPILAPEVCSYGEA